MGKRSPNPRLAKTHRNYSVGEIAALYKVHKNTVPAWRDAGLTPIADGRKPLVFVGADVSAFLEAKRTKNKHPLVFWPNLLCRLPRREGARVWGGGISSLNPHIRQPPRPLSNLHPAHPSAHFRREPCGGSGAIEDHIHGRSSEHKGCSRSLREL